MSKKIIYRGFELEEYDDGYWAIREAGKLMAQALDEVKAMGKIDLFKRTGNWEKR